MTRHLLTEAHREQWRRELAPDNAWENPAGAAAGRPRRGGGDRRRRARRVRSPTCCSTGRSASRRTPSSSRPCRPSASPRRSPSARCCASGSWPRSPTSPPGRSARRCGYGAAFTDRGHRRVVVPRGVPQRGRWWPARGRRVDCHTPVVASEHDRADRSRGRAPCPRRRRRPRRRAGAAPRGARSRAGAVVGAGCDPTRRRRRAGASRGSRPSGACASNATSTASSTRGRGGAWRASARCSSPPKTTTSAPVSPTRSRWRRSPPASPAPPTCACPLVEAIALAHDCGHGPAGHASEEAFSPFLPAHHAATTTPSTAPTSRSRRSTCASRRSTVCATTRGGARRRPRPRARSWPGPIASRTCATTSTTRCAPESSSPTTCRRRCARSSGPRSSEQIGAFAGRGARRHRPDRRSRHDRAGGVRAGGVPGVQLRADLPAAGGAPAGRDA